MNKYQIRAIAAKLELGPVHFELDVDHTGKTVERGYLYGELFCEGSHGKFCLCNQFMYLENEHAWLSDVFSSKKEVESKDTDDFSLLLRRVTESMYDEQAVHLALFNCITALNDKVNHLNKKIEEMEK